MQTIEQFSRLRDAALCDRRVSQCEVYLRLAHRRRWCLEADDCIVRDEIFDTGFAVRLRLVDGGSCFGTDVTLENLDLDRWTKSRVVDAGPIRIGGSSFREEENQAVFPDPDIEDRTRCEELHRLKDEARKGGAFAVRVMTESAERQEHWFGEDFEGERRSQIWDRSVVGEHPQLGEWAAQSPSLVLPEPGPVDNGHDAGPLWVFPGALAWEALQRGVLDALSCSVLEIWVDPQSALGGHHDDIAQVCPDRFRFYPQNRLPPGCHVRSSYRDLPLSAPLGLSVTPRPVTLPEERFRVVRLHEAGSKQLCAGGWRSTPKGQLWVEEVFDRGSFGAVLGTCGVSRPLPFGGSSPDWVFRRNSVESNSRFDKIP